MYKHFFLGNRLCKKIDSSCYLGQLKLKKKKKLSSHLGQPKWQARLHSDHPGDWNLPCKFLESTDNFIQLDEYKNIFFSKMKI